MFDDENVIKLCIQYQITVQQYFFMYLLATRDYTLKVGQSLMKQYVSEVEIFPAEKTIDPLVEKGFLMNMNSPGEYYPELFVLDKKAEVLFVTDDMATELWENYPVTFPLYDKGSRFLARTGGDKEELLTEYLKRIKFSSRKHKYVMEKLKRYKLLVSRGEINGYKISDWIRMELWDSIEDVSQKGGQFGQDI